MSLVPSALRTTLKLNIIGIKTDWIKPPTSFYEKPQMFLIRLKRSRQVIYFMKIARKKMQSFSHNYTKRHSDMTTEIRILYILIINHILYKYLELVELS